MSGKPTLISTFAGCGGSSLGYKNAGFKELLAIDWDENSVETFKLNFDVPVWQKDIKEVSGDEILKFCKIKKGDLDVLDGSPPCQGFSMVGKRQLLDPRNDLFLEFFRLIKELEPKVFVMENVPGMAQGKMKGLFKEIMVMLKSLPYEVKCKQMNSKYYGVPQSRSRLIWVGVRKDLGKEPSFPIPSRKIVKVREALKNVKNKTFRKVRAIDTEVYSHAKINGTILKDVPKDLIMRWAPRFLNNKKLTFRGVRRIDPNKASTTITKLVTNSNNEFIHFKENRQISIEEAKRLCSFPDDFKLTGSFAAQWARLGNSVMPKFMEAIALNIKENIL